MIETNNTKNQQRVANIPQHVPEELVQYFDFINSLHPGDVYLNAGKLHQGPDIFYTPQQGGHWVMTRYEDIEYVFKNPEIFASDVMVIPKVDKSFRLLPVESNPPLHTEYRAILQPYFSPKKIGDLEQRAREVTLNLIDNVYAKGECEFVDAFALIMPTVIFMSLVNLPESDAGILIPLVDKYVHGETPLDQQYAFMEMVQYVGGIVEERKSNLGDDMLSAVLTARIENDRPLNDVEILGMATLLFIGGLETVASTLSIIMRFLAENDSYRKQLVSNPSLIKDAIEEIIRRHPTGMLAREVAVDTTYKGVVMKKGDLVLLLITASAVDDCHYPDPYLVDFSRSDKKNLAFGRGPHACIGAFLARTELQVFLTEWLQRIPDFAIKPGTEPVLAKGFSHTYTSLNLKWNVK